MGGLGVADWIVGGVGMAAGLGGDTARQGNQRRCSWVYADGGGLNGLSGPSPGVVLPCWMRCRRAFCKRSVAGARGIYVSEALACAGFAAASGWQVAADQGSSAIYVHRPISASGLA